MDLAVLLEQRFDRTPDGAIWTQSAFPYRFWADHLGEFDGVKVVARVVDVGEPRGGSRRSDGPGVTFRPVPDYRGPIGHLRRFGAIRRAVLGAIGPRDAVLLRVCSPLSMHADAIFRRSGRPYGVWVVADPFDAFAPGSIRLPFREVFRRRFTDQVRRQCAGASAAAYVTESALQERYPPAPGVEPSGVSDIELPDSAFVDRPRTFPDGNRRSLVFVGTLARLYKAPDVLIEAVGLGVRRGLDLRLTVMGDGAHRAELRRRSEALGLADRVEFLGHVPAGGAVIAELDRADLFVLPSRQEGLPRAMVEAMARALPCVGSTVGGIPELLEAGDLVPPGDADALARKIGEIAVDPGRLAAMSARNRSRAGAFRRDLLLERQAAFLRDLRGATDRWLGMVRPVAAGLSTGDVR